MAHFNELKIPWDSRPFGMEYEFTRACSQEALAEAVRYALPDLGPDGMRVADWEHTPPDNTDWVVKRDGSCGWEISTPKSHGFRDMLRCMAVLDACRKAGAKVGPRTGVHLHFQVRDFNERELARLVRYWVKMEGVLFFSLPRKRRGNSFCLSLSRAGDLKHDTVYSDGNLIEMAGARRYRALNIKPYLNGMSRIEIRVIEGTMNPETIKNWTAFFLYFIQRVKGSEDPEDLRWYSLDGALEWLRWYNRPGADEVYIPDQGVSEVRDWWLRRVKNMCSVRAKTTGKFKKRASDFLKYFNEGNQGPIK